MTPFGAQGSKTNYSWTKEAELLKPLPAAFGFCQQSNPGAC